MLTIVDVNDEPQEENRVLGKWVNHHVTDYLGWNHVTVQYVIKISVTLLTFARIDKSKTILASKNKHAKNKTNSRYTLCISNLLLLCYSSSKYYERVLKLRQLLSAVAAACCMLLAVGVAAVGETARDRRNAARLWQMKWRQMQFNFSGTMRRMRIFNTQVGGNWAVDEKVQQLATVSTPYKKHNAVAQKFRTAKRTVHHIEYWLPLQQDQKVGHDFCKQFNALAKVQLCTQGLSATKGVFYLAKGAGVGLVPGGKCRLQSCS